MRIHKESLVETIEDIRYLDIRYEVVFIVVAY